MKINLKQVYPHLAAIAIFVIVAVLFCKPALEGKVIQQSDVIHWKGMSQDIHEYSAKYGKAPLWTNSMFSGMPGYQIATNNNNYLPYYANEVFSLFIPKPFRFFILACFGFYFLGIVFRVNPWLSMIGALGYAYASYSSIIISVGHDTKMLSMAYMPALLGAIVLVFNKRYLLGAILTGIFSSVLISHNHYQIVYYFVLIALALGVALMITAVKERKVPEFLKPALIAFGAGLVGLFTNAVMIFTTYDYSKATIRGGQASLNVKSEDKKDESKGGLSKDYAFLWSYGIGETMTLMVPNIYGGATQLLPEDSKLIQTLNEKGLPQQFANQLYSSFPAYWGPQPNTAGPVYAGAVLCFLFILGLIVIKGKHKWWIAAITLLAIMMSWGKNFPALNYFLFDHLPMYNKFRAPSMILVIPQLTIPLLAIMGLNKVLFGDLSKEEVFKKLKVAGIITAGVLLIATAMYVSFDYKTANDKNIQEQLTVIAKGDTSLGNDIMNSVTSDRKKLFSDDLTRSFLLVAFAFMLLILFNKKTLKAGIVLISFGLLCSFDMIGVSARFLNNEKFLEPEEFDGSFAQSELDQQIKQDPDQHYRVLNLSQDVFNDAITSYNHRSIGGYHAAKLSIYQDLIENQLAKQPLNNEVLNMLDTKYVIVADSTGRPVASINPGHLGAAWFVSEIKFVKDAKTEMNSLDSFVAVKTAIVNEADKDKIKTISVDSTAKIELTQPGHDTLLYKTNASTPQFAVFSEIFYDRGWKAFVDGKEQPIIKTNYALRGLYLEAGKHDIEFRFIPESYYLGYNITKYSQWILIALTLLGLAFLGRNMLKSKQA